MPPAHKRYFMTGLLLAVAILLLDQGSKWWMLHALVERREIVITSFFNTVIVWNYGISFGMLAGQRAPLILTVVSLLIVGILLVWLYRNASRLVACALGCVIGGAVGNVVDRQRFGAVVDFLDFHIAHYHWPAFNIADSAIFIGVVLLCASSMVSKNHTEGTDP